VPSSTSNSDGRPPASDARRGGWRLIAGSVLTALALCVLYNGVAAGLAPRPWFFPAQHQWQRNVTAAQEYLYDRRSSRVVVVGSSMAAALDDERLPADYFNLAFTGRSVYDGLEVIRRSRARPEVVLVEANVLLRPYDEAFIQGLFVPVLSDLRNALPGLRARHEPASLLLGLLRVGSTLARRRHGAAPSATLARPTVADGAGAAPFETMLRLQLESQAALPERKALAQSLASLKAYVDELRGRGVEVMLFEMPNDPRVFASAGPAAVRAALREALPPSTYTYLPLPDNAQFTTTDAVHLDGASAGRYTASLVAEVEARRPHGTHGPGGTHE
jgi:hypothetical protein